MASDATASGDERFEVRARLGAGASGVVYAAWDRARGAPVALKTLRRVDPEAVYRLKQEFRARADVAHPNLVSLFELLQADDRWVLSMELVDGVPFLDWVRGGGSPDRTTSSSGRSVIAEPLAAVARLPDTTTFDDAFMDAPGGDSPPPAWGRADDAPSPPPDLERLRAAFRQLAEGVDALHRARRLHRDLKPANVLVTREGRVVLVDFGLTEELRAGAPQRGIDRRVAGTAAYMSPEQAAGGRLAEPADWYAVGVMLFEALTGRRPFEGEAVKVLAEKQAWDAPPPSELCPGVPGDLEELCVGLLARDPATRPVGREVLSVFGGDGAVPLSSPNALVGRGAHLSALHRARRRTQAGRPVVAWVRGPSGMGKSTLLERFRQELRVGGRVVLSGRCFERETVPYNAFDALAEELATLPELEAALLGTSGAHGLAPSGDEAALLRLFPQLGRAPCLARVAPLVVADPRHARERAFRAFVDLLAALAPAVLLLDDVQWGDADSVRLLGAVLDARAPLLVVLAYRAEEEGCAFLTEARQVVARAEVSERRVDVAELSPREATDLALLALQGGGDDVPVGGGGAQTGLATRIAAESGGNPLFVEELCRWVLRHGETRPPALDEAIRDRAGSLPPPAREVLELLAVVGCPVAPALVQAAIGRGLVWPELDLLRGARLVRTAPERVELSHDRVREAVVASLDPELLAARHRSLAVALEAVGTDPDPLVLHWEGAREGTRAAVWAARAAEEAERALAFDRAARRWRDALRLGEAVGEARGRLLERLGAALRDAGHGAEAGRALREAARLVGGEEAADLVRRAAEHLLDTGHADEGTAAADEALAPHGLRVLPEPWLSIPPLLWERARLWWRGLAPAARPVPADPARLAVLRSVGRGLSWLDFVQGDLFLARHLRAALDSGDRQEVVHGLCSSWGIRAGGSPAERATLPEIEARAVELCDGDPDRLAQVSSARAMAAFFLGEFEDAARFAREGEGLLAGAPGKEDLRTTLRLVLLWGLLFQGLLLETRALLTGSLREARDRGNLRFVATATTEVQSVILLAEDRSLDAVAEIEALASHWKRPGRFTLQHQSEMLAYGWIDAYTGEGELAHARIEHTWPELSRSLLLHHRFVRLEGHLLRARCALGAAAVRPNARLLRVARRALRACRPDPSPWSEAQRQAVEGTLALAEGRPEAAVVGYRRAVHDLQVTGQLLQAEAVRHRLGRLLGGDEGRALVARAELWMRGQGVVLPEAMVRMVLGTP